MYQLARVDNLFSTSTMANILHSTPTRSVVSSTSLPSSLVEDLSHANITPAVLGGMFAGVISLVLIVSLLWYLRSRRKKHNRTNQVERR
jgi:preprotein translocase subunit SecF